MPEAVQPSPSSEQSDLRRCSLSRAAGAWRAFAGALAVLSLFAAGRASAQTQSAPQSGSAQTAQATQNPVLPRVNTTVIVHGDVKDDYFSDALTAGTLSGLPLSETPLNAIAITQEQISDQQARLL